jgi:hypothetical protein
MALHGAHVSIRAARARLIFSREARAFRRSGDPRFVRTRPLDTVQNNADNSLGVCFCSSWLQISFIVFPPVRGSAIGAFHEEAFARRHSRTVNELHGTTAGRKERSVRCTGRMESGSVHLLKGPVRNADGENVSLY